MGPDDWPDWLPTDWSIHIRNIDGRSVKVEQFPFPANVALILQLGENLRVVMCYVHPEGHNCHSKQEVFDYLNITDDKTQNADDATIDLSMDPNAPDIKEFSESIHGGRPTKLTPRTSRKKSPSRDGSEVVLTGGGSSSQRSRDDTWLPEGWTVEVKARKLGNRSGMRYKCFIDPITGQKFFSKPQVMSFLAKSNRSAGQRKEVFAEPISAIPISAWQENQSTEPDNSQTYEPVEVKKTESVRLSSEYEVQSRTPVDGLPPGWIKEVRVRKRGTTNRKDPYYLDPLSEYVFLSKIDAMRYLETGDVTKCAMKPLLRDINNADIYNDNLTFTIEELTSPDPSIGAESPTELPNSSVEEMKTHESGVDNPKLLRSITGGNFKNFSKPEEKSVRSITGRNFSRPEQPSDWLPDGWVVEMQNRSNGKKLKVFKETASGKRLYSKPQVLEYLENGSYSSSRKKKEITYSVGSDSSPNGTPADVTLPKGSAKKKVRNSDFHEVITTSAVDDLPPGWIREVRTKMYETNKRSDSYYVDPVKGYVFRSKVDVKRYLENGDVSSRAYKRKVKDINRNEASVDPQDLQKPLELASGKHLSEDKGVDLSAENHEEYRSVTADPETAELARREVNLEKRPDNDGELRVDIPEDEIWSDQCMDFAVKTLANEFIHNGQPISGSLHEENGAAGVSETPTKVN